ncbi:hypothetical protein O6027_19940 [Sphingomonas aerolata]|uniref:hypothetical protein n=1 Tax=Sphingomonas aerolata TaxID=185951 RepID=UPI00334AB15C
MKADEPRAPVVKYGMSTDETERMVQRHVDVVDEQYLLEGGVLDHNLRVAAIVNAKLHGSPACNPIPCDPPVLPGSPVPVEPAQSVPQDLRALLGLS